MNILHIDSSPQGEFSVSRQLTRKVVEQLSGSEVAYLDLAEAPIEHLQPKHLAAFFSNPTDRSLTNQELLEESDELVEQLLWADTIVIGVSMINFAIPSTLKAWLDQIVRAGRTFRYGESGPEGLVQGKKVLAISTGGVYTEGPSKQFDFTEPYLRTVLGFLGMTDISTVRAEGVKLEGNRERAIEAALNSIPMAVDQSGSPGSRVGIA